MMTERQLIEEFRTYPRSIKSSVLRTLLQDFEKELENGGVEDTDDQALSVDERLAIVESLAGIASVPGKRPPTDEEWREERTKYLLEKHK